MRRDSRPSLHASCFSQLQRSRTRVSAERSCRAARIRHQGSASTEPHSCECGEKSNPLQTSSRLLASTEPHSCECGENSPAKQARAQPCDASTEPHSCECGELGECFTDQTCLIRLQRSRTRVSAESSRANVIENIRALLQRSRTRVSAESTPVSMATIFSSASLQRSRTRVSAESCGDRASPEA